MKVAGRIADISVIIDAFTLTGNLCVIRLDYFGVQQIYGAVAKWLRHRIANPIRAGSTPARPS